MLATAAQAALKASLKAAKRAVPHLIAHKVVNTIADAAKKHIFGFMDDYTKVTYGMRDTLQLIRKGSCSVLQLLVLGK